jgi:predicted GH43/DUF377 family glycosyl hydrolase
MKRYSHNPIITRNDIPDIEPHLVDVTSVFNPGAVRFDNRYVLLMRVQNRGRETYLLKAESDDGIRFEIDTDIINFAGIEKVEEEIYHVYDPRITPIGNTFYIMIAMDMQCGCRLGLARTEDFEDYHFMGIVADEDNRNGVLFPQMINGRYLRLDRPNRQSLKGGTASGSIICLSESYDLLTWRETHTRL